MKVTLPTNLNNLDLLSDLEIIPIQYTPNWVIKNGYEIGLDQYYTKPEAASYCYKTLIDCLKQRKIKHTNSTFIEPSAGCGNFYKLLPTKRRLGFDLEPMHPEIQKMNFFSFTPNDNTNYVAIGNPPFGARSWMALAFMNYCSTFCEAVGFILPMYFASIGKGSAMRRVKGMRLVHSEEMPKNIFTKENNKEVDINTVFQVWVKDKSHKQELDLRKKLEHILEVYTVCTNPSRRCGLKRMDEYDCFLPSTYYSDVKVVDSFNEVKYGSGYGIIVKQRKKTILNALHNIQWNEYCLRATNHCKHLGISAIFSALIDHNAIKL